MTSNDLLLTIARCPNVARCTRDADSSHPCSTIVNHQAELGIADPYVPEPWSGHIETAPILFFSSNPSITGVELAPKASWSDEKIADFYENRFDEDRNWPWIRGRVRNLQADGTYRKHAVRFWASVRGRATELLDVPKERVRPGIDYALSEVVHCNSHQEVGVREALDECVQRYFEPVLEVSGAKVVVCLGEFCGGVVRRYLGVDDVLVGPIPVGGRARYFTFLPHPNAFKPKTFAKCLTGEQFAVLRAFATRP